MTQHRSSGAKLMILCNVKSEGIFLKFWAWPQSAAESVREIDNQFYRISSELEAASGFIRNNQTPIGLKCAVKSKIRGKWCRARVAATFGVSDILVQLIDYGIEETVSVADARKIDEYFFRHPPLALECILADVEPYYGVEWTPEAVRFCEHHLVGQTLSCYAVSEHMKIPVVRVAKQGESQPFVQRLIDSNLARIKDENRQLSFKMNALEPNSIPHLVKVSCVETPYKFFVQLISAEMELKNMMNALQKYAETEQMPFVTSPFLHMPCLTQSTNTSCYYRSLVTGIHSGMFKVLFVDYGYCEMKEFQELKVLPPRFFELAAQAICCSIPREIEVDTNDFSRATSNKQFTCHVLKRVGDIHIVNLQEQGRELIAVNSAQPMAGHMQLVPYKQQKLAPGQLLEVTISSINDINEFFCQMVSFKDQLKKLSQILNSGLDFMPLSLAECQHGMPACVKYSDDNLWYRAQIMKINSESDIEVFFVDYGNNDNANIRDVCKMIPDLMQFQTQAFKFSLYDVHLPDDQSVRDDMFDLFEELTTGQTMTAQVKTVLEDMKYDVILLEKNGKVSINEKLESNSLTVGVVPVSDVENLFVTHFEAPDSFFAQFEKLDSNKLSQMQEEINEYYCNAKNSHFKPKVKNLVCAKFLEDEQFYRARVEVIKDSVCEVSFIDYGNKEQVSLADIHPMNKKFAQYPKFGISCALEKFPAATPVEKLSSLMVDNPIQAKMLREQNGKWYISLTESFANNVPILELLRQHELVVPRSIHGAGLGGFQSKIKEDSYSSNEIVQSNSWQEPFQNERKDIRKQDFEKPFSNSLDLNAKSKSVTTLDYEIISIPPNAYRNVYVSHVISPSEFYCQIEEENFKLLALMKNIEDAYSNVNDNELNLKDFAINLPCCAVFEDDGAWYRGKIQKVNMTSCEVFFVDYGNVSTVPKSKIKVLLDNLVSLPGQALRCKSYNVSPKSGSWSDADIDAFTDMTLDKSFVAQFVESDNNGTYSVNLVNIGKLQEDVLTKEFVSLGHGRLEDSSKILVLKPHAASSNLSFNPVDIDLNLSEAVEVTYGLNPGEIYCQLKSQSADFKTMMEKLQNHYSRVSDPESLIDRPHPGMICVAQFFQDSAWYRATIKKVEKSSITVFYVDYGNSEAVDKKKIRAIIQDFTILPTQAIKCHLKGIKPPGKSWQINSSVSKYYEGDTWCKFLTKENDYYVVEMTCNKKNVVLQLVQDGLALCDEPITEKSKKVPQVQANRTIALPGRELNFVHGQLLTVAVSFIESPSKFWCQLVDESDILDNLMADIEAAYQEPNIPIVNVASLTVSSYCMAKYSEDQAWYRAQIKSFSSQNECEVFFIDYGNSEVVSGSQVASLLPEFTKLPPQCFECKLQNSPLRPDAENTRVFQDLVGEAEELTATVLSISNNVCTVALTYDVDNEEVNVSEVLFGKKNVDSTLSEFSKFLPPDIPLGLHDGYVSTVNTPQDFFIQLASCEDALTTFATELAECCEKMVEEDSTVAQPAIGLACCAKYSEDDSWYRAEVIALQENSADVLFVDYGNAENVPLHSLKVLDAKFLDVPPYAIKCKLNGVVPIQESWTDDIINTFHGIVDDCLLGVTFISKDIPAIVNLTKEDKDVAQTLVDMELANVDTSTETGETYAEDHLTSPIEDQPCSFTNDQSYPRRKFIVASKVDAKVCYVDSCDRFYIMPVDFSTNLDTVTHLLKILYGDKEDQQSFASQVLDDIKPLTPCVAKYSEDETWYRALITEVDGDNICVSFVDYGNSEIISLDNLKPITRELFEVPVVATECSLFGMQAVEGKEQEISDKLEEFYVEEVDVELEICACNPLKVKLYHNGADFITDLISEGLAVAAECNVDSDIQSDAEIENESSQNSNIVVSPPVSVDLETNPVSVKFYEIENNVVILYAVPIDLNEELENLQAHLNDVYNEMERKPVAFENMTFCVAKYSEDECWYRAQILSSESENIKVKFIDYGNSEVIDVKDINVLIPEFAQKPQFSIRCILPCYKVIEDKKDEVCSTLDECIYEEGVQLKPCLYTHTAQGLCLSAVIYSEENIFETMLNNELVTLQFPVNNQVSSTFVATVEKFEDGIFFIIPLELKKERESFQLELQKLCTSNATPPEIDQKHFYAVKKSDDWYRAVLMTSDGDSAVVKLIDFESSLQVKISDLVLLPSCFYHQPLLLQPCQVDGLDSIPAAFIDKFASDVVNNVVPVTCSLLDPVPKCYPLKVKLFVYNNEICEILKNINDCSEIDIKIEENTMEEVTKNVLEQDNIKQETEMEDNPDSEIIFENNVESQEIIKGESEEKELLNDTVEKEVKTNNNSEDLHTDETMPIIIKADAPTCDSSEDIICEEETEVLLSVDNNEESVECLTEQKMDLTEQNVMSEDSAVSEELNSLEKISENIEQNAEANIPNVGVCAPKNTSAEGELHYNVEVNLKSNEDDDQVSEADYEEAVEDISHSGNASLSNNNLDGNFEEECQETDLQTEISHQDICIKDSMFVDSENKHSDNFEFKSKLEENFQFLNEESNEDKFNKEGEAESIEKVDQSRSKCLEMNEMKEECNDQSIRNESAENLEASCELNTCEIAGASKESDEIFETDESVDENEKNQVESKQYLKEMDLEISKAENENQKFSGFSIVDAINENEDESINIKFDKTEVSVSSESEAKSASIVNNECQDSNKAIECTDASQTVDESSNVIADIDSNLNTSSDDHKESVEDSELQSETIINTDNDECQDGNLAVECTDVSESASQIVPESNFSEKTNSNLNTTSDDDKGSIEVPEIQSEIIINTDNDECQDDDLAIECTDTSESTFQIVPESSNFFKDTNCDLSTTSDDHKKNFEVFEQSETIDQSKGFESSDICTSKAVELFESESVLATDFDSSDANSTGLFSNRHISGKINALVSEISISGNSVILAVTPSDLLDELSQFSNLLQSTYSSKNIPFEKNVSQLCAILSDDDLWYRAKVLGFSDGNFISLLIDNGLCKDIDVAKVRNLEPEHEIIPPFSIWCTLASVSCLDDKTEEVVEYLKTLAKDKLIEINVIEEEEPCKVSMFVDGVNVLNELLKKNLVIQTLPVNCVEANQSATISYCHISDSDIKLFINLAAQLEDLENLKKCMQVSYSTEAFEIPASESSVCAVFYKDLWLRAQMLSSEGKPCAKLIDFGEYIYDVQNFYALLPEYCLYPPFAIPCPVSLTCKLDVESSKDLKNILGSSKFTVKLETVPETQAVSAVIVDKDLINKIKKFGICFEYSTRAAAEIFADGDNVKNNCLKLTCKELDDIKLETLNEMGESVSTKEYVSLLNESFSTDSSID